MTEFLSKANFPNNPSKNEIINWVNSILKLNITKIEQACTGAIYCQILDSIYPNKVKMNKVNWKASHDYEFLSNLKVLQQGLIDCKVEQRFDISKLAQGRFQDNFETLLWFKSHYDSHKDHSDYDPLKRRKNEDLTYLNPNATKGNKRGPSQNQNHLKNNVKSKDGKENLTSHISKTIIGGNKLNQKKNENHTKINNTNIATVKEDSTNQRQSNQMQGNNNKMDVVSSENIQESKPEQNGVDMQEIEKNYQKKIDDLRFKYENEMTQRTDENYVLKRENASLKMTLVSASTERDFYLQKLRLIEMLSDKTNRCSKEEVLDLINQILMAPGNAELVYNEYEIPHLEISTQQTINLHKDS